MTMEKEVSIQSLLDKIKEKGIDEPQRHSREIPEGARSEAEKIVREAEKEAQGIIASAREEAANIRKAFENDLRQRGRDLIISTRNEIIQLFDRILSRHVASVLTTEFMKEVILRILEKWDFKEGTEIEILADEGVAEELEERLCQEMKEELRSGVMVRPVRGMGAGFRIGAKGGDMYYDITDEAIVDILMGSLHPRIARLLGEAARREHR
ncbi:MAG: hypothetical protein JRJ29_06805 [Deltaproteobacteria bacterium]|nr:hypothetical protein [Deltaproteobacteria bacterium]